MVRWAGERERIGKVNCWTEGSQYNNLFTLKVLYPYLPG